LSARHWNLDYINPAMIYLLAISRWARIAGPCAPTGRFVQRATSGTVHDVNLACCFAMIGRL
jgi:hypothetical protein